MRCATAIPASPAALENMVARGLHPHSRGTALSAILRGDDGDRERRGFRRACARCAGSRRSGRCRLIMTIRSTSTRSRPTYAPARCARFEPERLLLSFHGMPVRTLELGDPYHCHCQKTARLLAGRSGARSTSPSSRGSAARSGLSPRRTRRSPLIRTQGVKADRGRGAGLFRRLHRNARRARHSRARDVPARRRRAIRLARLPQRFAGRHRNARTADRARTCRLAAAVISRGREERIMARVAIVTGGTRGIGEAISIALQATWA